MYFCGFAGTAETSGGLLRKRACELAGRAGTGTDKTGGRNVGQTTPQASPVSYWLTDECLTLLQSVFWIYIGFNADLALAF